MKIDLSRIRLNGYRTKDSSRGLSFQIHTLTAFCLLSLALSLLFCNQLSEFEKVLLGKHVKYKTGYFSI